MVKKEENCAVNRLCDVAMMFKLDGSDRAYVKVAPQVHIRYNLHVVH